MPAAVQIHLEAGDYAFRASIADGPNYIGATSICEQFTVNKTPLGITTQLHTADHTPVTVGTSLSLGTIMPDLAAVSVFGPAIFCQACSSDDLESVLLSRQGTLYSFTVVRVPPAGWPGKVPYTLGEVELPEGPHVLAEIIDSEPEQLKLGMPMELALERISVAESNKGLGKVLAVYKWRPLNQS